MHDRDTDACGHFSLAQGSAVTSHHQNGAFTPTKASAHDEVAKLAWADSGAKCKDQCRCYRDRLVIASPVAVACLTIHLQVLKGSAVQTFVKKKIDSVSVLFFKYSGLFCLHILLQIVFNKNAACFNGSKETTDMKTKAWLPTFTLSISAKVVGEVVQRR